MRISVTHSTIYRYDSPVWPEPHTFRLKPRQDAAQRLIQHQLQILPAPAGSVECLDQDGNLVLEAWFDSPLAQMSVASSFTVETLRENPFDFLLTGPGAAPLPMVYPELLGRALTPYLATRGLSPAARKLAERTLQQSGGQPMAFLAALNGTLFDSFAHVVREDGAPHEPETTIATREGTCRDLAVLFCAAARAAGIAARFVSGYEREAALQERAYMHAWAEVYLPGGGWRGFDPSQGLAVAASHVTVAAAAEPSMAAPVSGTFRGEARSRMQFAIAMQADASPIPPAVI